MRLFYHTGFIPTQAYIEKNTQNSPQKQKKWVSVLREEVHSRVRLVSPWSDGGYRVKSNNVLLQFPFISSAG